MTLPFFMSLEGPIAQYREREIDLLGDIAMTLAELGDHAAEDRRRLLDVAQDMRDMFFMVVVIGEFNAGKSTFINALLGDELLAMGITPTTEAIHLIRYGETPTRVPNIREDGIYEWMHPNTGAPGVSLVDTPGTGSVFQRHETTAKAFLHRSDLVIFVISAKRAFSQTERLYLDLARGYGKKIILVVNQVDLLEANEQQDVRRFVERQVEELLDLKPLIFMVSAREGLKAARARVSGAATMINVSSGGDGAQNAAAAAVITGDSSGMDAVRAHLNGVYNQAPPARQKLLAQLDLAERVVKQYLDHVKGNYDLVGADRQKAEDVQRELEQQSGALSGQLAAARAQIDSVFEGMRLRGLSFINHNLSMRRFGRPLSREVLQAQFQEEVVGRALRDIETASNNYINALIDQSRQYWRGVIERLNQLKQLMDQELAGLDSGIYAEQREALQDAIRIAEAELKSYSSGKVIGDMRAGFQNNLNRFSIASLVTLGGAAFLIAELATASALLSGTVGLLVPPLILATTAVSGLVAVRYLRRASEDAKRELNTRIDQIEKIYHEALDELTQKERRRLTEYGSQVLMPIFSQLEVLSERYGTQQSKLRSFQDQIISLRASISAM